MSFNRNLLRLIQILIVSLPGSLCAQDLLQIYELGLQYDPVLRQAEANRMAVGESKDQSIAQMLPNITAQGASSYNRLNNSKISFQGLGEQKFWEHTFALNLTQPVFHWDHWVQLSQSDNLIAEAEAGYQAEHQNLMFRITEAYFNVLAAQDNLEFAEAEKKAIARQLEQAQQRFNVGLIAITDVHESQAGYDQVRSDVITAMNEVDNAKEALREIIGQNDGILAILGEMLPLDKPVPDNIKDWSENAKLQNLQIVSAVNRAEAARKTIEIQRSGHYPQLDIVGNFLQSDNNSTFGLRGDTQEIGLQLNIPIFEGGGVSSRTRQAEYEYQQAAENLVATKRAVEKEVKNAYRGVITTISRVEALKAAVISGESALEATEAGFDVGTRTMVDVLTATRNLTRARSDHSQARYDYLINGVRLKQAASSLSLDDLEAINRYLQK